VILALASCGGGGSAAAPTSFSIGGNVTGLTGSSLTLQNNLSDNLTIAANGGFTFSSAAINDTAYSITIQTQPTGQTCKVAGGSGVVDGRNVTSVVVTCAASTYTIGGTVSGLYGVSGTGVVLQNNGSADLTLKSNGNFAFPNAVLTGVPYSVNIASQPTNPWETCTLAKPSGTVNGSNVTSIAVSCTPNQYTEGGTVSGLVGPGLVLVDVHGSTITVNTNGSFVFPTPLSSGDAVSVTVRTQPSMPYQTCIVANGTGTVGDANITSIAVTCTVNSYTVGGTISGLIGAGRVVVADSANASLTLSNGAFTFPHLLSGTVYSVAVTAQLTSPNQTCVLQNADGLVTNANITNVTITCASSPGRFAYVAGDNYLPPSIVFPSHEETIAAFIIDAVSGSLTLLGFASPDEYSQGLVPYSYPTISVSPNGNFAYAPNQVTGHLHVFAIGNATGQLTETVDSPITITIPTYSGTLAFNSAGTLAYFVSGGQISAYVLNTTTGTPTLSTLTSVPAGSSTSVIIDPLGRFAYAVDTSAQNIYAYTIDPASGALSAISGSPFTGGTGPLAINPTGTFCYVPNSSAQNITGYAVNSTAGTLTAITGSPFAAGGDAASVSIAPSGAFAYIVNQTAQTINVFSINPTSGALSPLGQSFQVTTRSSPASLVLHPSGNFAYLLGGVVAMDANPTSDVGISEFSVNTSTGLLTSMPGVSLSQSLALPLNLEISY
jgi:6-phosphogluconolactonase (cycloisomerase 2 family)